MGLIFLGALWLSIAVLTIYFIRMKKKAMLPIGFVLIVASFLIGSFILAIAMFI
jgi:hypothetical protein